MGWEAKAVLLCMVVADKSARRRKSALTWPRLQLALAFDGLVQQAAFRIAGNYGRPSPTAFCPSSGVAHIEPRHLCLAMADKHLDSSKVCASRSSGVWAVTAMTKVQIVHLDCPIMLRQQHFANHHSLVITGPT